MLLRREDGSDQEAIRAVHRHAFPCPEGALEPGEVGLVDALRESVEWLPKLSLVAELDGHVVGHVVGSRGYLTTSGDTVRAVGLGPFGVLPQWHSRGFGAALMHAIIAAADALDEPFAALLGNPAYYTSFGFRPAAEHGIEASVADWKPHFQIRRLAGWRSGLAGTFHYAEPFRTVGG